MLNLEYQLSCIPLFLNMKVLEIKIQNDLLLQKHSFQRKILYNLLKPK